MLINFFKCAFGEAEERTSPEDLTCEWIYYCDHPLGSGQCFLDNKYDGDEADCPLLDKPNHGE